MKIQVLLQPCPWCKKTPELIMPIYEHKFDKTWCWKIQCINSCCGVKPESPHVALRNTTKGSASRIAMKLGQLADKWNIGNDYPAYEYKVVDVTELIEKYGGLNGRIRGRLE